MFNGDGKPDLASNGSVLLGNGNGTFRPLVFQASFQVNDLVIADFNHDGKADVAVSTIYKEGYTLTVFLGQGDGTFQAPASTSIGRAMRQWQLNELPGSVLVADLNSDGLPDLIVGFDILLGNGNGSFQTPRAYSVPESVVDLPVPFAAADFDGDGRLDLAVGSRYLYAVSNHILIFRGKGDGTMLPPTQYEVGWQPAAGAVADLDGDGCPDLVTANLASNTVSLLLSRSAGDPDARSSRVRRERNRRRSARVAGDSL